MFSRFLSSIRSLPPRGSEWAGKAGPVALLGCDYTIKNSGGSILSALKTSSRDADYYAELSYYDKAPVDVPPDTVAFMPVLRCGDMTHAAAETRAQQEGGNFDPSANDWHLGISTVAGELVEKGYIPVVAGGSGEATLPVLEAIKRIHSDEDIVLLHFSASPAVSNAASPIRVVQDKSLVRGVISVGNRMVSAEDRKVRREKKMHYLDAHALFSKGLFCVRDLRNDFPVYISIDIGCLDPSAAPGAIYTESGGLMPRELIHLLHGIRAPKILGVDIHGYNPDLDVRRGDGRGMTTFATSKLVKESILKVYSVSTATQDEGLARVQMMQRQGSLSESTYPEH